MLKLTPGFSRFLLGALVLVAAFLVPEVALGAGPILFGMAGDTTVTDDIDEALKIIFSDPLINNIVEDTELMDIFKVDMNVQADDTTGGRFIEMAHYFRLPAGVGARAENEYIPEPDDPRFVNSRLFLRKLQGTVEMTGDVMRRVRSDEGAFLNYMERALPDLVTRLVNEIDRMYISDGSGIKCRIASISGAAGVYDVVINRTYGIDGLTASFLQFMEGERIVADPAADGQSLRSNGAILSAQVTDIDEETSTLEVTGDDTLLASWAPDDYIFSGDDAGQSTNTAAGEDREIAGLLAGDDDGGIIATYNNIDRTASGNRLWKSIVIDSDVPQWGGQMTEELLTFSDDQVTVKGAGRIDTLVMSRSANRGYWQSLKGDRTMIDPRSFTGGKAGTSVLLGDRTLDLKVSRKLPPELSFGLQSDTWRRITLGTWEWDDRTGSIWNRVTDSVGRKDAFFAVGNMYEQLFCMAPRKNFRLDNITAVF
jgi:hypothetical protein